MKFCKKCGQALPDDWEGEYCEECEDEDMDDLATAILHTESMYPNLEDL